MRIGTHLSWVVMICAAAPAVAGWKDDVGFTALQNRLGGGIPTGDTITVTHVEAPEGSNYMPDVAYPDTPTNAEFLGKMLLEESGSSGISNHSLIVGRHFYGSATSMAPAIGTISIFEANDWIGDGFLRTWTRFAPRSETRRVQNHSWIGSTGNTSIDADGLRRIDLVIERDGVVVAAGVNNGAATAMPALLSSAYNVLAVGLTNGNSSYGPTSIDAAGRVKPDIVAPLSATSWATPVVGAAAALLLDTADADSALNDLDRTDKALLAKALLMGGATKDEFADWRKGFASPGTDDTVPLDYRYGAGELNIDNSHRILTSGEQEAGPVGLTGWDFDTATTAGPRQYVIDIPAYSYVKDLSILVTWNRHITTGGGNPLNLTPSLANIDLAFYESNGAVPGDLVDQSVSDLDNVEHVFLSGLFSGQYVFEVITTTDWDYAITWDVSLTPTPVYDLDGDGDADVDDVALFEACATGPATPYDPQDLPPGCELTPSLQGIIAPDLDLDGDVDQVDFGGLQACLGGSDVRPPAWCLDATEAAGSAPVYKSRGEGFMPIPVIGPE